VEPEGIPRETQELREPADRAAAAQGSGPIRYAGAGRAGAEAMFFARRSRSICAAGGHHAVSRRSCKPADRAAGHLSPGSARALVDLGGAGSSHRAAGRPTSGACCSEAAPPTGRRWRRCRSSPTGSDHRPEMEDLRGVDCGAVTKARSSQAIRSWARRRAGEGRCCSGRPRSPRALQPARPHAAPTLRDSRTVRGVAQSVETSPAAPRSRL